MATPYETIEGGSKPLPRVHIPTWFGIKNKSDNNDALLDLNLLINEDNTPMYTENNITSSNEGSIKCLNMGGENITNTDLEHKDSIFIGDTPSRQGSIIAYSNDNENVLEGTNSAHILYFKHAVLHSFNFSITHNHVIDRIEKLYRMTELTELTSFNAFDITDFSVQRMKIKDSDAQIVSEESYSKLKLKEVI